MLPGAWDTYSRHPCNGVVQRFSPAAGPKLATGAGNPDPGSSINSRGSEVELVTLTSGNIRLVTLPPMKKGVMLNCGIAELIGCKLPPVQVIRISPTCSV